MANAITHHTAKSITHILKKQKTNQTAPQIIQATAQSSAVNFLFFSFISTE